MGNEKWILYVKCEMKEIVRQEKWTTTNHTKSLSSPKEGVWWDWKGILYYKLLLENLTIISNKYVSNKTNWKQHMTKSVQN